jgi:hypothetical protein
MNAHRQAVVAVLWVGVAAGLLCAEIVKAQTKAEASDVRVTVIGCIQRSSPPIAETAGGTVILEHKTQYVLSNITLVPDDGRTRSADDRSIGQVLAASVKTYGLDDSADSLVASHVGDRVQVTGTVVDTPRSPTGTTGRTESPAIAVPRPPTLRVDSLQNISSDSPMCSQ